MTQDKHPETASRARPATNLQRRLLGSMVVLVLLSSAVYTGILLTVNRASILRDADARLLAGAHLARNRIGRPYHDRIEGPGSIPGDEFNSLVAHNDDLCRRHGLQYIWSVLVLGEKVLFTSAAHSNLSDPRSDCAAFLEVHTDPEAFGQAIRTESITYSTFRNKWGQGRQVLIPARDCRGRLYLLGASIQLDRLGAQLRWTVVESLGVGLGIAGAAVVISWLLSRSLSAPIVRLTRCAQEMAQGDLNTELPPSSLQEVGVLAESLDALRRAVRTQVGALRQSEAKYRTLVEQIPACTYTAALEPAAPTLYISPQIEQMAGFPAEQWMSRPLLWLERLHPEDQPRVLEALAESQRTGGRFDIEYRVIRADGACRWFRDIARIVFDGERAVFQQGVMLDVTERRQLEEERNRLSQDLARRADQLRRLAGDLSRVEERERRRLAHILHDELQQLMVGAKIYIESGLAEAGPPGEGQLRNAVEMLDRALRVSRSLTSELSPPILYQSGLAAGLMWLQRWMREKHGLEVQVTTDEDAEPQSEDLRVLLFRAVQELLFNVLKHSGASSASVRQACRGDLIEITVRDDGCGFDPAAGGQGGESGGFGLFSIRERLSLAGGSMQIDSGRGRGTSVVLRVPIWTEMGAQAGGADADRPSVSAAPGAGSARARPGDAIRVVLADDHEMVRKGLVVLLEKEPDIQVVGEAADGRAAVELAGRLAPDVVVMDVTMPVLNGVEAARILRDTCPGVRVLMLSMHPAADLAESSRQAGAVLYLSKDRAAEALVAAIRSAVGRGA